MHRSLSIHSSKYSFDWCKMLSFFLQICMKLHGGMCTDQSSQYTVTTFKDDREQLQKRNSWPNVQESYHPDMRYLREIRDLLQQQNSRENRRDLQQSNNGTITEEWQTCALLLDKFWFYFDILLSGILSCLIVFLDTK